MTARDTRPTPRHTRRNFVKSAGAVAAGAVLGGASRETLAMSGGAKAVTYPGEKHAQASRWPLYGSKDEQAVLEVIRRPSYRPIEEFENDWKEYLDVPYVKAHCNGTSALASMYFALNLPAGSEILVPSYTFFATIMPMRLFGLVPVFVDINPRTLNFDLDDARRRLTKNTKALVPVHWIGRPCEMDDISAFAKEKGLILLEDAAHAQGASMQGRKMGAWGRMAIFSYQASKPLPTIEGGMAVYQDRAEYERGTTFGNYDWPNRFPQDSAFRPYQGTGLGLKFRMHPVSAALGRVQLRELDARNAMITAQVRRLNDRICTLPGLYEQGARQDMQRIYYAWNMLFLDEAQAGMSRAACVKALQAEGVRAHAHEYRLQHKCAVYTQPQWWHHLPQIPELPGSEQANRTAIGLPLFTSEVPELVGQYAAAFEKVWAHRKELAS
jgi:dTDP-4-amino-4,6-dideoxygalactose transaminase